MNEINLWNKKTTDITVGDTILLTILAPIAMMGSLVVVGTVLSGASTVLRKLRKTKPVVVTPPTEGE